MAPSARVAVLIDGENASAKSGAVVLKQLARLDPNAVRRIYGNFNRPNLKSWDEVVERFQVTKISNCAHPKCKNVSDIHLTVEAMDLLHRGEIDTFWIVSSDSDFTQLAQRLRESGKTVIGFGRNHTPHSYREACSDFVIVEKQSVTSAAAKLLQAFERTKDNTGWAYLGAMGQWLRKSDPKFDPKSFGCSKLIKLVQKVDAFVTDHAIGAPGPIRVKPRAISGRVDALSNPPLRSGGGGARDISRA
jgi:uncharacterized protein (TIGR00288 family)